MHLDLLKDPIALAVLSPAMMKTTFKSNGKGNATAPMLEIMQQLIGTAHSEIEQFRRIESEKAGRDIGWEQAEAQWMARHFTDWKCYHWHLAVEEALRGQSREPASASPKAQRSAGLPQPTDADITLPLVSSLPFEQTTIATN